VHRSVSHTAAFAVTIVAIAACSAPAAQKPAALPPVTPIMIPPAMTASGADELTGRTWSWQRTTYADGRSVVPDAPERYTIEFMGDGRAQLRADCNRGGTRYDAGAHRALSLAPAALTKMGCPRGSKDVEFVRQLNDVSSYRLAGNDLELVLKSDGGAMRFTPVAR